ncbi:hypothetical protein [Methylorubrum sp. SB2]|uniref:hypothetical protein n=1 Tax=Methylorubrum subtropicum TaxID=3138812 RepID=UPI00313EB2A4
MGELLLITDDCRRGERLARDLGPFRSCRLHDLYDDVPPTGSPELIITDVSTLTSPAIERLQRVLGLVRGPDVPFLFLTHGNAPRAAMQAQILGANGSDLTGWLWAGLIERISQD